VTSPEAIRVLWARAMIGQDTVRVGVGCWRESQSGRSSTGPPPGLFHAVAVGKQGCFLAGCCTGCPDRVRFGIWSSDGRVGVRRIPAQQLEALVSVLLATGALLAFLALGRAAGGLVFAGTLCEARPSPIRKVSGNRLKPDLLNS
jgi:hypothetical protein